MTAQTTSSGSPRRSSVFLWAAWAYDTLASGLAFAVAYQTGMGLAGQFLPKALVIHTLIFTVIAGGVVSVHRLNRAVWRYTSLSDAMLIVRASLFTAVLVYFPFTVWRNQMGPSPSLAPVLAFFFMIAFLATPRILARYYADGRTPKPFTTHPKLSGTSVPVIVVGAAGRIEPFVRELHRKAQRDYSVVAILTQGAEWHGRHIHGVGVLGGPGDLAEALTFLGQRRIRPLRLIIADDEISQEGIAELLERANGLGLSVGRLPRLTDFVTGAEAENASAVQPVDLPDLLGRPQVVLDREAMRRLIFGRSVLVTGAGGSIGSELCRQIADFAPSRMVLVENSEFNLYAIGKELDERAPGLSRRDVMADVRDGPLMQRLFGEERPAIVFHAAALKHVPLVEANPIQGARTNVLGVQVIADACARFGAAAMVLISTDKAVNPHNVMGATKRWAEAYCQAMDLEGGPTRFVAVRFGNVLGSSGSVAPLFQRQIAAGGPVTVTHPDVTRFFMTIPEAVQLVLQASALGSDPDSLRGEVHVLDMGKPIRILDLARQMIRLSGKQPDVDIKIAFIGLRPGEKLYEELVHEHERHTVAEGLGVFSVSPRTTDIAILRRQMAELSVATGVFDEAKVLRLLQAAVPEFAFQGGQTPAAEGQG
ncbi:MAG TPA: nucleoside-diphosphate sugar epimerase/dehydratase [Caulobacteraceae bacterium]|nr:nucleoside-diphosphate sugar epimerase/dehydratase [Caulobacteraceae bacterium]